MAGLSLLLLVAVPTVSVPVGLTAAPPVGTDLSGVVAGTVTSDLHAPLGGAIVALHGTDGSNVGSARSEPDGTYTMKGVAPGTYNLSASARGHADLHKDIVVGASLAAAQDLELKHTGSVVRGQVTDGRTGRTVEGATVEASATFKCKPGYACPMVESANGAMMQPAPTSTRSDADGAYVIGVEPGHYGLRAFKDGFQDAYADVEADRNASADLQMNSVPPKTATLAGQVTDSKSGKAVPDAWVSAWPTQPPQPVSDCPPEADCAAPAMPIRCCYYNEGNSTQADANGRFRMGMQAGTFMLSVNAPNYGSFQEVVELQDGEVTTVDVPLERIPDDSVAIRGQVLDKVTGKPIVNAYVSVENQQWGAYNGTQTDAQGRFSVHTKPGWTQVWVRADYGCCVVYAQTTVASGSTGSGGGSTGNAEPQDASSDAPQGNETGIRAPDGPMPQPNEGPKDSYYPWVRGQVFAEDQSVDWRVELQPKPKADIRIAGYVLNATTHKAIPGAWVNIHNEDTGDWGYVQTDKDGSFVLLARAGMHTVQAGADGYFGNSVMVAVKGPETRVDLDLQPGRTSGYCCIAYAGGERAVADGAAPPPASAPGAPQPQTGNAGAPGGASAQQALTQAPSGANGPATYKASGGLGPYDPNQAPSGASGSGVGTKGAPMPAVALVLAGVAAAAIALRKRGA